MLLFDFGFELKGNKNVFGEFHSGFMNNRERTDGFLLCIDQTMRLRCSMQPPQSIGTSAPLSRIVHLEREQQGAACQAQGTMLQSKLVAGQKDKNHTSLGKFLNLFSLLSITLDFIF
ncbi:uncharacterized protein LOC123907501 [Trifolium pratense]|uniref:uncharacterized protein LOC123907501 n=1 Tax=Trifolium pratense TaxID=57577 RepID=UPI001E696CD0|nr:uncharacterized protein LOC123907501 [Trifolium pratense]